MYLRLQDHLNKHPGTVGPVHPDSFHTRRGELETIRMLWEGQGNSHEVCAILISASLFSRMHSSRGIYPRDSWPPYTCVSALDQWANDASGGVTAWHHACTQVIPEQLPDHDYKIETLGELVDYLAEEHAAIISRYTAVIVDFKSTPSPLVSKTLKDKMQSSGYVIGNGGKITKPAKLWSREESVNSGTCIHGSTSGRIYQERSSNAWSGPNLPDLSQQTSECPILQSVRSAAWKVLEPLS
jgi:hypothetical protein